MQGSVQAVTTNAQHSMALSLPVQSCLLGKKREIQMNQMRLVLLD